MMKSFTAVLLSTLAVGVYAQVPANTSAPCTAFLEGLDKATDVTTCLNKLTDATAAFATSSTPTDAELKTALGAICTATCDQTKLRAHLADFYAVCQPELTGSSANAEVVKIYDLLYVLTPLQGAVCAKNADTGKYCIEDISAPSTITKRQETVLTPDVEAYRKSNLPYLYINPSLEAAQLCTSCTASVVTPYVEFGIACPYAMGIGASPLLGGQVDLWNAITEKCPADFSKAILIAGGVPENAAPRSDEGDVSSSLGHSVNVAFAGVVGFAAMLAI